MKYVCKICGYIYDEAKEKTPFDRLPKDWVCPLCGAQRAALLLMEKARNVRGPKSPLPLTRICGSLQ